MGRVSGNRPRHLDAFPEVSVRMMVPKRLSDALVQLQSRSGPADASKSVSWTAASIGRFWSPHQQRPVDRDAVMRPADASGQGTRSVKKTEDQICTNQTLLRSIQLTHRRNCVDRTLLRSVRLTHDCKCNNQSLLVIEPEASNAST
ncbi:hypothetical protein PCANC_19213 [Puccinia coronata f. sp. avenae]|uniref:Uncharacterized protein n=1 Tax=Puccinia coronata f. sp. avenae TaxID=200324 RepID=A0A2N5U5B8_9BASI|nr:hypothetical protein PCANC_19213 [Puccinia coronata f. sp. avenae]PLW32922.1 hypothetical protein PCASD_12487 [Puccinia coronata f. sp. avenae]